MGKVIDTLTDYYERPLNIIRVTGLQKYANSADMDPAELHSIVVNYLQEKFDSAGFVQKGLQIEPNTTFGNNSQNPKLQPMSQCIVSNNGRKVLFFVGNDFSTLKQAVDSEDVTNVLIFSLGKFRKDTVAKQLGRTFNYIKMPLPEMELSNCPISPENIAPTNEITNGTTHFLLQGQLKHWAQQWNKMPRTVRCFVENALIAQINYMIDCVLGPIRPLAELFDKCCRKQ